MEATSKRSIGEMSHDARLLLKRITELKTGEEVSYDDLSATIQRSVKPGHSAYPLLISARRAAERDGIVTDTVCKFGIKRLDDNGIVESASGIMSRVHRFAKKGVGRLVAVADFDGLSPAMKTAHNLKLSMFGVLAQASSAQAEKRLLPKVENNSSYLPVAQTLEELKGL